MDTNIELMLDELDSERRKFTQADEEVIQKLVDKLVELGVYPTTPCMVEYGYSVRQMVDGWGARWHIWSEPHTCPKCNADWRDQTIGPPFKREIGIVEHDRCVAFQCPDCKSEFTRR